MQNANHTETICAIATAPGMGSIAVIRVSGPKAFEILEPLTTKKIMNASTFSAHLCTFKDGADVVDEVVVTLFRGPSTFTGEDVIEIACHGSTFIQQEILQVLIKNGCRLAKPGEFSMRAFFNGKVDLSQAEAIADLVASKSKATHFMAMQQMRGGYSMQIKSLREQLIHFASLIELELDFSEEDVEFADRSQLTNLIEEVKDLVEKLVKSFAYGNVIKNGVPVAIIGAPNVGKSTLLNALLQDDKAIVSDIPGTTRDVIEDTINIEGISFRFIDTAGIREAKDEIEAMGIERTYEQAKKAEIILYLVDSCADKRENILNVTHDFRDVILEPHQVLFVIGNKIDRCEPSVIKKKFKGIDDCIFISAKNGQNIEILKSRLTSHIAMGIHESDDIIVSNVRHYEALSKAFENLAKVDHGIHSGIPGDLLAMDIRLAIHHLGEITGEITTDDLLGNIFSKFCIGK